MGLKRMMSRISINQHKMAVAGSDGENHHCDITSSHQQQDILIDLMAKEATFCAGPRVTESKSLLTIVLLKVGFSVTLEVMCAVHVA